ncbi:hypothetical protein AVEN_150381-1, partial [Araneus ventricosus]
VVICYYGEGSSEEIRSKFTDSSDDSKTLFLGRRVVLFGSCQRTGCVAIGLSLLFCTCTSTAPMLYPLASECILVSAFGRKCPKTGPLVCNFLRVEKDPFCGVPHETLHPFSISHAKALRYRQLF